MTIQTVMLCDACDNVHATETRPRPGELTRTAREAGWTTTRENDQWRNYCDECTESAA